MVEIRNPFVGLVGGRLATYFDEAFIQYGRGKLRGAYDYCLLAFNSTVFELKPGGKRLFEWLEALEGAGKIDKTVVDFARSRDFLVRHDRGITDMDLSYMSIEEFSDLVEFLTLFYRSLQGHGVMLASDPRPT